MPTSARTYRTSPPAQGALLAAMLRDPGYYDPSTNLQAAQGRWDFVLDGMVTMKKLSAADRAAQVFPQVKPPRDRLGVSGPKALIVQRVINELDAHGISENEINTRGLIIHTTIDRHAQNDAEAAIATTFGSLTEQQRAMQAERARRREPRERSSARLLRRPQRSRIRRNRRLLRLRRRRGARPSLRRLLYTLATVLTQTQTKADGKPQLDDHQLRPEGLLHHDRGTQDLQRPGRPGSSAPRPCAWPTR